MSQFVEEALCLSFRSLPPKEAIVAVVSKFMVGGLEDAVGEVFKG